MPDSDRKRRMFSWRLRSAEGPLMYSRLAGTAPEELIGRPVRAVFVVHGPEQKVPFFELDDA